MKRAKMCSIGIDPAFRKDGFAVCIIDEVKEVSFKVFGSFLDFLDWLSDAPENAVVCVENSNLQNKTFDMSGTKATVARKSRNVGANQAASQYTFEACKKKWGKKAFEVSPQEKGKKWSDAYFRAVARTEKHLVTQYEGTKKDQDKRDAYQLALIGQRKFSFQSARIKTTAQ